MGGKRVSEFYSHSSDESPKGNFHEVIALHDGVDIDWQVLSSRVPTLCKGWYELAQLSTKDRIEFTQDFWLANMPYHPYFSEFITQFFSQLDNVGVYVTQRKFDDPLEPYLVYSLRDDSGFFSGAPPATEEETQALQAQFPGTLLPNDYLAFLRIHNGFCKTTDCTGLKKIAQMPECQRKFQANLKERGVLTTTRGEVVDPHTLIPFYESFGMPFFQCFWSDWYPAQEMGNVYYSGIAHTISDVGDKELSLGAAENLSFSTFTDWLTFYLDRIA